MPDNGRFAFGRNWRAYAESLDEVRIASAEGSLKEMLGPGALAGRTFLDIGSGSGLFSLAAHRLGASKVVSFDYDADSVAVTAAVREARAATPASWTVTRGSILDESFCAGLGTFDVVYSWGVLHHTGAMWKALDAALRLAAPGGRVFIALYNDEGFVSSVWRAVKRFYNLLPRVLRPPMAALFFFRFWFLSSLKDLLRGRPFYTLNEYKKRSRGMSPWHDVVDWVGGYPFEVASPAAVESFCAERGFALVRKKLERGHGCNEFVFVRGGAGAAV